MTLCAVYAILRQDPDVVMIGEIRGIWKPPRLQYKLL
ncbi:ATPase, T2SS/T4P/T4SS family [Vibrio lentus]|nr:ATPase, T2SS/T4P/T4SS family [Vibrio lentus]